MINITHIKILGLNCDKWFHFCGPNAPKSLVNEAFPGPDHILNGVPTTPSWSGCADGSSIISPNDIPRTISPRHFTEIISPWTIASTRYMVKPEEVSQWRYHALQVGASNWAKSESRVKPEKERERNLETGSQWAPLQNFFGISDFKSLNLVISFLTHFLCQAIIMCPENPERA